MIAKSSSSAGTAGERSRSGQRKATATKHKQGKEKEKGDKTGPPGQGQEASASLPDRQPEGVSPPPVYVEAPRPGTPLLEIDLEQGKDEVAPTMEVDDNSEFDFSEISSADEDRLKNENPSLQEAPSYFVTGLVPQNKSTKQVVQRCVRKVQLDTKQRFVSLKSHVNAEFENVNRRVSSMEAAHQQTRQTVTSLQKELTAAIARLDKLEKNASTAASSSASTASGLAVSSDGLGRPQGVRAPERWDGWQSWTNGNRNQTGPPSAEIDRGRMYGGNFSEVPRDIATD
eukprot:TRINITY_DN43363_c0_g1_i1.p1 TRINITY_DN43363_c0_g1~~TRINITY_DN43363_c0_g1_i1.p1  ORF type:complete len:286 (+),score=59.72 TRINITY_DN43363_c0_g1_i1:342-1199(+)